MNRTLAGVMLTLLGGAAALLAPSARAANIGYFDMCGYNQPAHAAAITAAGHTPVAISTPNAAALAGLAGLSITNCSNGGFSSLYTSNQAAITSAVNSGMVLIIHDRAVTNANTILPGGSGLVPVRNPAADINLPAGSPVASGPGGVLNNSSLDGGTSSDHGYVTTASLPAGGAVWATTASPSEGVTVRYPYGAGSVVYSTIPLDYYLGGSGPNPPRDNFVNVYLPNLLAAAVQATTCASSGYTGTQLEWCKNICERGYTGATLEMWIRRWLNRWRELPYCARPGGGDGEPVPALR